MVLGVAFVWFAYIGWGRCNGAFGLARAMDRGGAHQLAHAGWGCSGAFGLAHAMVGHRGAV
jgi:hypothetical protein